MSLVLHAKQLPWPVDWTAVFGRSAPLWVEIGFGRGEFLVDLAQQHPAVNVLGVEIALPSLRRAAGRVTRAHLTNVRLVQGGAEAFLQALCPPHSLSRLILNFPDPWHKLDHHSRRLINPTFLHLAATRLVSGARLEIATDHDAYTAVIAQTLAETPYFSSCTAVPYVTTDQQRVQTKYELKALAEGRVCRYFHWQRNQTPAADIFPILQELPMPHVILRSPLTLEEISQQYAPFYVPTETADIKFAELFRSQRGHTLLVETYIREEPLSQRVGLTIHQRLTGEMVVGLHEVGFPRTTPGIHRAIGALASWVRGLAAETAVVSETLAEKSWLSGHL